MAELSWRQLLLAHASVQDWFFTNRNCVFVGRGQKTAAFDAVFGVVPTPRSGASLVLGGTILDRCLAGGDLENFKKEHINGDVFLGHASDWKFFKEECNLPAGPSDGPATLASEVTGKETIGTKSQSYLSRHAHHTGTS
jgi:hypothetical protein